ncbi:MAG: 50S ribosomal protein L5 [Fidelibacterota bacterium]
MAKSTTSGSTNGYRPNLLKRFHDTAIPEIQKKLGLKHPLEVSRLEKIVLNMGVGRAKDEPASLEHAVEDLTAIAGQRAVVTRARKAISNFKIRAGDPVGCRVTLRGWRMYEFLERLIKIALPRVRDFSGFSLKSFDGRGNFHFGLEEQIVFPEIDYDKIDKIRGLNVSIVTTAESDEEGFELLKALGFPFREMVPSPAEESQGDPV